MILVALFSALCAYQVALSVFLENWKQRLTLDNVLSRLGNSDIELFDFNDNIEDDVADPTCILLLM